MIRSTMPRVGILLAAALFFAACSGGSTASDAGAGGGKDGGGAAGPPGGGTSGGGDGGGFASTDAGSGDAGGGGDGGSVTYCDGIQVASGSEDIDLILYPLAQDIAASCATLLTDAGFATSGTLTTVGGIWDSYAYAAKGTTLNGLYPGGCDDVGGQGGPASGTFTAPDAGMTVAAAVTAAKAAPDGGYTADVYGVVTFVSSGWGGKNGSNFYLQDPAAGTPVAGSGVDIYVGSRVTNLPASAPARGDVVLVTGVKWSPYNGINEFGYQDGSTLTVLGQSALPTPFTATAAQLAPTAGALDGYKGMRVTATGSFAISPACPSDLQYTSGGGGG